MAPATYELRLEGKLEPPPASLTPLLNADVVAADTADADGAAVTTVMALLLVLSSSSAIILAFAR